MSHFLNKSLNFITLISTIITSASNSTRNYNNLKIKDQPLDTIMVRAIMKPSQEQDGESKLTISMFILEPTGNQQGIENADCIHSRELSP